MTTNVKRKTKATVAKGTTKGTGLKKFLSTLATDPRKLGEFLHEPEAAMSAANLSEADKAALKSGVSGMVAARLAGVPVDQAFQPKPPFLWMASASQTPASALKDFCSNLATDPRKLGEFLHEPEAAMSAANLSEADKVVLKSGVSGMVAARLAGVPVDQAFQPRPTILWMLEA